MKAKDVLLHFQTVGSWVDWSNSCDRFLYGDPEAEVTGIATAWIATNEAIEEASEKGCNLFITHEGTFYWGSEETTTGARLLQQKKDLLDKLGMTLMRCHDTWDRMPQFGVRDAWAEFLGFETEESPSDSFYRTCLVQSLSVERLARAIAEKTRLLGQDTVLIIGDRKRIVQRMAVGTGASTHVASMYELAPDVILATDDGINAWTDTMLAADVDVPLIVVSHATAEKPGMQGMAKYLKGVFPGVPVEYVDVRYRFSSVRAGADV